MTSPFRTREWFEEQFKDSLATGEDNWGHQWRASVKYKYRVITKILRDSDLLIRESQQKLLDIGCGLGDLTNLVYQENPANQLYGIDVSANAILAAAKKYPHIIFQVDELPGLSSVPQLFDGVLCIATIYYLNQDDRQKSLQSIYEILVPHGWLLISVPLIYMSEQQLSELVRGAGFAIKQQKYHYARLSTQFEKPFMKFKRFESIFSFIRKTKILEAYWLNATLQWLGKKLNLKSNVFIIAEKI